MQKSQVLHDSSKNFLIWVVPPQLSKVWETGNSLSIPTGEVPCVEGLTRASWSKTGVN